MKLREIGWDFMNNKIGNGNDTWLWVDNWHPHGPPLKKYGTRVIYDSNSTVNAKVKDFITNGEWHMPKALSSALISIKNDFPPYRPNIACADTVEWVLTRDKIYSCRSAWEALRQRFSVVDWADLLWHKGHIPRCRVIC